MTTTTACRHRWLIEPVDARQGNKTLNAVCKHCDARRTFPKVQETRDSWGRRKEETA